MSIGDRATVLDTLTAWLVRANPALATIPIGAQTDIIESRILESLQLVEFILFLEQQSGRRILVEDLDPNVLRTLDSIYRSFFEVRA